MSSLPAADKLHRTVTCGEEHRIAFTVTDSRGGSCTGTATVGVPHDQGKGSVAVDSAPASYDSFGH